MARPPPPIAVCTRRRVECNRYSLREGRLKSGARTAPRHTKSSVCVCSCTCVCVFALWRRTNGRSDAKSKHCCCWLHWGKSILSLPSQYKSRSYHHRPRSLLGWLAGWPRPQYKNIVVDSSCCHCFTGTVINSAPQLLRRPIFLEVRKKALCQCHCTMPATLAVCAVLRSFFSLTLFLSTSTKKHLKRATE